MDKTVFIQIVAYNSEKDILNCLASIINQTYKMIEIMVIDNASIDQTTILIKKHYPNITLIENNSNKGFCNPNNYAFTQAKGEYIIVINPDVILDENFIDVVVRRMEEHQDVGIISGKILRMDNNFTKTNIIDSTGIILPKSRRAYDRGQGEVDLGQYDNSRNIFGACGAAAVYRRAMLEDISLEDEYFDEDFFAYKEDVDLSWRSNNLGWKCLYVPEAIAYHKRGWSKEVRKKIPDFVRVHSVKNRYLMMLKNERKDFLWHFPYIITTDLLIFIYCIVREPKVLRYIPEVIRLIPKTIRKRRKIIEKENRTKHSN